MAVGESAEVRREGWLRGDWHVWWTRLPSQEWLKSKLPTNVTEWYLWLIMGIAIAEIVWSMVCKLWLNKRRSKATLMWSAKQQEDVPT